MKAPSSDYDSRDLRSIVADGVLFSIMVAVGETYLPAFVLAVGHGAVASGLIASVPPLAGAVLQLVTPFAVRRLRSYRRWVVLCACLQAASFAPLIAGALAGSIGMAWVAASAVAYWAFGMATSPAWNAWVTSIVPLEMRARFFARRNQWAQLALLAGLVIAGVALDGGPGAAPAPWTFAALFATAMAARLASASFIARQSEPAGLAVRHDALSTRDLWTEIARPGTGRLLAYLLAMQVAVYIAAPYFTPFMLDELELTYGGFMVLTAAAFASRVAVLPLLGQVVEKRGARFLMGAGAVGIVPLPALWLLSDHFAYLLALQLLSGLAWAAVELATLLSFFEGIHDRARASVLTVYNLLSAAAMAIGATVGAQLLVGLDGLPGGYGLIFAASSLARLLALPVVRHSVAAGPEHVDLQLRTLAVRPSAGAVQRPVLATLPEEPGDGAPSGPVERGGASEERGSPRA
jgi:MFS family permease